MKKLKLKENEVVHCATLKQAKKVLKIAHELGLTWNEDNLTKWNLCKEDTCYNFNNGTCISYADKDFYMYDEDFLYKVITSKEFIKRHKKTSLKKRIKALEAIVNGFNESKEVQQPQIGDVVKAWDDDKSKFVYGVLEEIYNDGTSYFVSGIWFKNIEKVTEISINDFKK